MGQVGSPDALAILLLVASCVIAYFVCGIPSGLLLAERIGKVDVRTQGSGNVGSTNVARSAGKLAGGLTLLCDTLKAYVSVLVGFLLVGVVGLGDVAAVRPGGSLDWMMALVYLFCIVGHVFTPYLRFKGGKGIAVGFGGALALMPLTGLSLLVPFLLLAVTTKRVSAGSITAAIALPFLAWAIERPSAPFLVIVACVAAVVVFAHRKNIVKLAHGEEKPFSFKRGDKRGRSA